MQARFLIGPAGSGKTHRCLSEIRAELLKSPEGLPLVLLAPKQATFQLERQLLDYSRWGEPLAQASGSSPHQGQLPGYTRLQILSFERLAGFVLAEFSQSPPKLLGEEGRVMVLRALLAQKQKELKIFRATALLPGFAQQLSLLLRELQRHQHSPEKVFALAGEVNLSTHLGDKLHDLALLLRAYLDWLGQHELQDADGLLDLATSALQGESKIENRKSKIRLAGLWLDGFAEMTPQELDLLAALMPCCERASLAFCLPRASKVALPRLSTWSLVSRTFQSLHARLASLSEVKVEIESLPADSRETRFADNPVLGHLERHWADPEPYPVRSGSIPDSLRVVVCANPEAEATFAAREILRHVRGGGRFRDVAVVVRALDGYHDVLRRVFHRYEIPFFLDRRERVAHHPLAELTRYALRTAAFDWEHDDWFGALKTGLVHAREEDLDELENEALARGWKGSAWKRPLKIANEEHLEKRLERLRRKIVPPFQQLTGRLAAGTAGPGEPPGVEPAAETGAQPCRPNGEQLADALRALWSDLKVEQQLERWNADAASSPHPALRAPHSTVHSTVWAQMQSWLENIALAFPREPLSLREWLPILETGLGGLTVGVIPPALDQVLIGTIDRSRDPELQLALVLGVNESVFPAAPATTALLTETDRDQLEAVGVVLNPGKLMQLAHERYYGYIACTRARSRLALSCAARDANDRALNPSPFIAHLQRLFPDLQREAFSSSPDWRESEHASELTAPLIKACRAQISGVNGGAAPANPPNPTAPSLEGNRGGSSPDSPDRNQRGSLLHAWEESGVAIHVRERLLALAAYGPTDSLSPALAAQLYGPVLRTSASALEQFAACPFKFFVRSGLRAEERRLFEADVREQGSFQHQVLARFHEQLRAESQRWRDLTPQEARERVGRIADELIGAFREGMFRADAQNLFAARRLKLALQDFIETAVGWMEHYGFDPHAVELAFGNDGDPLPAWEIDLGNGYRMAFRGKIDRLDLARDSGRAAALCVVIDYKSGAKKIDPLLLEHGVQIQLPAYLAALRRLPNPGSVFGVERLIPAGVFYVNLRGSYQGGKSRREVLDAASEARRLAYQHTGRFSLEALPQLDRRYLQPEGSGQFNYKLAKGDKPNRTFKDLIEADELTALLDQVEELLRLMGRGIFAGAAKVDPYRKGSQTACDHCDYRAVCRIDPWRHLYRTLKKSDSEAP